MNIKGLEEAYEQYIGKGINKDTDNKRLIIDYSTFTLSCDEKTSDSFRPLSCTEIDILNHAFNKHSEITLKDLSVPLLNAIAIEAINDNASSKLINEWASKFL
jgi:hypothetical protein